VTGSRRIGDCGSSGDGFTAASYNIHRCVGADGRRDPERVARVITDLGADIIGLQEVDSRGPMDTAQMDFLGSLTRFTAVSGSTIEKEEGSYGNVLLSGFPVMGVKKLDLSFHAREPRGAIDAVLRVAERTVRVIVTHLGLRAAERRHQVRLLLDHIRDDEQDLLVVMGDVNEWSPFGHALRSLNRRLGKSLATPTFPSRFPILALDRIWVHPRESALSVRVHRSAPARAASDHLPVKVKAGFRLS
jgi:endonuclease/exonuclease/phosphatase family metal-dependent hydrolase